MNIRAAIYGKAVGICANKHRQDQRIPIHQHTLFIVLQGAYS